MHQTRQSEAASTTRVDEYDPFLRGRFPAGVRTIAAHDAARNRTFPCEIWYPAAAHHAGQDLAPATQDTFTVPLLDRPRTQMAIREATALPGSYPLILFSHSSGGGRRQSTFLCTHLASHGYVVAAIDHSELVTPELARPSEEPPEQMTARIAAWMANRVPDITFLLDHLLTNDALWGRETTIDPTRIGIVGHSFGGWTALAAPDSEQRIAAVVALAPAGSSQSMPGMIRAKLALAWGRDVPALYLVAADDVSLPLSGMFELFERTPATKVMLILRRADHLHFMDDAERLHEAVRATPFKGELAWLPKQMRPIAELCSAEEAHLFTRGLTLCHLDATLRRRPEAQRFFAGNIAAALAARGIDAIVHGSPPSVEQRQ